MKTLRWFTVLLSGFVCACGTTNPRQQKTEAHEPDYLSYRDDHGNHLGCSWYCGAPPIRLSATSSLRDGIYSYAPDNAHDAKKDTVWVEGADGHGIGERIVFTFDLSDSERYPESYLDDYPELGIDRVSIINGFARDKELWKANGRAKALKVYFDGRYQGTVELEDTVEPRWSDLPKMAFTPGRAHEVAFEIAEVYPGSKYEDTAIADFFFSGFGVH